jgi:hypothetical protein
LCIGLSPGAHAESGDDELPISATWSATLTGQYEYIAPPENNDGVAGWFDQYDFTPNKSSSFPFEIGLRDGSLDLARGAQSPLFQARLESPTSNLGVSGSQIDQPFFNQRLDALTRLDGIDVDLFYRRIRTEQLRLFPNTLGPGLVFQDMTQPNDRFQRDRTGFWGEARFRPYEAFGGENASGSWLAPELSVRGGYDWRAGLMQQRVHRGPTNDWLGLAQDQDRSVSDVGGGLLVAPGGYLTVALDFDYEQLRFDSAFLSDGDLGYPPPQSTRTIGFVPNSDRSTGTIRFNGRLGEVALIEGGLQVTQLDQEPAFTADQRGAGLATNRVRTYSGNAAITVPIVDGLSANGLFKFDRRKNDIQRDTFLFNPSNGTQIDPFLRGWQRFRFVGELNSRFSGSNRAMLGVRYDDVSRELDFAYAGHPRILPQNTQVNDDSSIITVYGKTALRPYKRLRVDAELGYRWAPATGYAVELDNNIYGKLRASYVFSLPRPLVLSAYVRGGQGDNDDFVMISGQGPDPSGSPLRRSYERSNLVAGMSTSHSPRDGLNLHASLFYSDDDRDTSLDLSTLQRYWQDQAPIDFSTEGLNRFDSQQVSFIVGGRAQLAPKWDGGLSYAYTWARAQYGGSETSSELNLVAGSGIIDTDNHLIDLELGHWLRDGLRITTGYRYQHFGDDAPLVQSVASVVAPYGYTSNRHTVTLGVTLTSDFFARGN